MPFAETYILDVIEERKSPLFVKNILHFLSVLYKTATESRHLAYERGLLKAVKVPACVVSIGNIVAGGTGKTPLVRLLAEELNGKKLAILTRGYRSKIERSGDVALLEGDISPEVCGDEPYWYAKRLPSVSIWVGKKRAESAKRASDLGSEIIILDDGMQHLSLHRDFEIIVLDGKDLFGKGHFLPRGLLRDHPKRLKKADLIVLNHIDSEAHFQEASKEIQRFSKAPIVGMRMKIQNTLHPSAKVGAFCALGKPARFFDALGDLSLEVVDHLMAVDHASFKEAELLAFAKKCKAKGAEALVCTEKDFVKLKSSLDLGLSVVALEAHLEITQGKEHWKELIEKITKTS
jgi:tetraacyldisaccharide 4'-kinase